MDIITYALSKKGIIRIGEKEYKPELENGNIVYKEIKQETYTTFTFRGSESMGESAAYSARNAGTLVMVNNVPNSITELYVNDVPQELPQISAEEMMSEDGEDDFTSLLSTLQVSEGDVIKVKGGFSLMGNAFLGNVINISDIKIQDDLEDCSYMFGGTAITEAPIIPSSATNCSYMFISCFNLTKAPVIPEGVTNCSYMFNSCENLTEAPDIPNSVINCESMFGYAAITEAPIIPSTVTNCSYMFSWCAITKAPVIPEGVTNCSHMFEYCVDLTEAQAIPSTAIDCNNMFYSCHNLTKAPVIPNSVTNCRSMFSGCYNLTEAPVIPPSVTDCGYMFYGCTILSVIPEENLNLINNPPAGLVTENCFAGCHQITDQIPASWGGDIGEYTTFTINGDCDMTISVENVATPKMTELYINGMRQDLPVREKVYNVKKGQKVKIKGHFKLKNANITGIKLQSDLTSCREMFRNCTNLTEAPVIPNSVTDCGDMFSGCTNLTEAPVMPEGVTNCNGMFYGCTSLTEAPVIPPSVIGCNSMFSGCYNLTEAPIIPNCVTNCGNMFSSCENLTEAPTIPNSVTDCYSMFYNCTSLTVAPVIPNSVTECRYMFLGCTSLTEAPVIPNKVNNCSSMFNGCTNLATIPEENINLMNNPPEGLKYTDCYKNCPLVADIVLISWGGNKKEPVLYTTFTVGESGTLKIANIYGDIEELYIDNVAQELPTGGSYSQTRAYTVSNGQKIKIKGNFSLYETTLLIKDIVLQNDLVSCSYMFNGCTGLTKAPVIPSSVTNCMCMFRMCTSLTQAPVIPNSVNDCGNMFEGCTNLTTLPEENVDLMNNPPAELIYDGCYKNCESIVTPIKYNQIPSGWK